MVIALVLLAALAASIMGGATGLGTAIAMIPVLAFVVGVREAVPIVTLSVTAQTASRVWFNRRYVDYSVARWFVVGAFPAAILGAVAFANAPVAILARGLAIFLILVLVYRHTYTRIGMGGRVRMTPRSFIGVGAGQGFLSALFGGAGPFGASFFLSYGLMRNAFVGTMAAGMTLINLVKLGVYGTYTLLDVEGLILAGGIGLIMVGGAWIGGKLIQHVSDKVFTYGVEAVILVSAVALLVRG